MSIVKSIGTGWRKFWQKNKRNKLFILSLISTLVFLISAWELLIHLEMIQNSDLEIPLIAEMDNYAWIPLGIGGIVMIASWLYYHDHNKNYQRFKELIETDSKANFVRNVDEIEELAIQLGPDFEAQVIDKRKEFKVKTR